jgi:hypothetical protein
MNSAVGNKYGNYTIKIRAIKIFGDCAFNNQCCQLLANDVGQISRKIGQLGKKFEHALSFVKESFSQRNLSKNNSHKLNTYIS